MQNTNSSFTSNINQKPHGAHSIDPVAKESKWGPKSATPAGIRTSARDYANPVDYNHPYESMARFADFLALHYDANRTRHAYYRQLRLIHQHFACDPAAITEAQVRDYFLFVKLKKHWRPKTIRQALAAAKMCFVDLLGKPHWSVFSQIRTKDHDTLPAVLTRRQVHDLLAHIRLRRYRTPLKLIYCCGLRLSECLGLTIHDIVGRENKLLIRNSKGHQDRLVPLPSSMYQELRRYWAFHRHPLLLFPNVGRGDHDPKFLAARMQKATCPMPHCSLQRLLIIARKHLNIPAASVHSLRHSFATHLLEAGAHLHTIQKLLGHKQITSTMIYLHLTHQSTQEALRLMDQLCKGLPR
jgi:site-specific recombinase XerD